MRKFTVVVPTWNMGRYLTALCDSITQSDFAQLVEEIIFVCEKSDDGSEEVIERLICVQGDKRPSIRLLQPEQRRGNFVARYLGAKAAKTERIFFIDSRLTLPPDSARTVTRFGDVYGSMSAIPDIDTNKNIFCLYWQRSHNRFYRKETDVRNIVTITSENFDTIPIGSTCFYCSRDLFVRLCEGYLQTAPLFSDDTFLMAEMVKVEPITIHPEFRVNWEPRDQTMPFLKHLYKRGPGLAQYHFFYRRSWLFYATCLAVFYLLAVGALVFFDPLLAVALLVAALGLLAISTVLISQSVGEFLRMAPLHTATILFYGFGALRGAWIVWKKFGFRNPEIKDQQA